MDVFGFAVFVLIAFLFLAALCNAMHATAVDESCDRRLDILHTDLCKTENEHLRLLNEMVIARKRIDILDKARSPLRWATPVPEGPPREWLLNTPHGGEN